MEGFDSEGCVGTFGFSHSRHRAFSKSWAVCFDNAIRLEAHEDSADIHLLGNFQEARFGIAVNPSFQGPSYLALTSDSDMDAEDGADMFPQMLAFGVAEGEQVVHMRPKQHPPPEHVCELVYSVVVKERGCAALGQHSLKKLLPGTGSLFSPVQSFAKLQYKSGPGEVGHVVAVWLFNPDIFLDGGVHESTLYIPVHAREIGV